MKKIKILIASMLSAIVLVFACVLGTRVKAAICINSGVSTYCTYTVTETKAKWDFSSYAGTATSVTVANITDANFFGLKTNDTAISMKTDPAIQQAKNQVIKLPVPADAAGTINIYNTSNNKDRYWSWGSSSTLYQTSKNKVLSGSFTTADITTVGDDSYLYITQNEGAVNVQYFEIVLSSGKFFSADAYCQLTIHSNGKLLSESSVSKGSSVEGLDDTFAYKFDGYYLDEDYENEFDYENDTIETDTELFIKWTPKNDSYFANDYRLSSSVISPIVNQIGTATDTSENINVNNIFTIMSGVRGYTSNGGAIATRGTFTTSNRCIKIDLNGQTNGVIVAKMTVGGNSARSAKMIEASGAEISCISGNNAWTEEESNNYEIRTIEYSVEGDNTYYLGGTNSMRVFDVEFIPESVTPLVQKATDDDYTYVRFVTIIKGVEEIDATDVAFSVTMTYSDSTSKTVNYTPYVVKKITQSGATYTANVQGVSHTFDNASNSTEYYVVYVLRLTTTKFAGNSVKATTTFGGVSYTSDVETI